MATEGSGGHLVGGRRVRWVIFAAIVVLNLVQQPGRTTFDTKLDLQVAPGSFLLRSLHLWNPDSTLGELQNQASGYLFPIGPYYWLGHVLHVPMWIWERGFSALLMIVAFEGMRRLARAWGGVSDTGALLAGLFFMLSPRFLSTVGALTGEALPTSILPWTVLPLVLCLRGRIPARRAVLFSAATIPFMGGQNATEVLAALLLPAIVLLVNGQRWATRLRLFAGWTGGAVVVSLWWLLPLVLLREYGPPFLDYVESARTTTDRIGWTSAIRGTDHWVTFLALGDSTSWRTGLELASSRLLLISTLVCAAIGLLGLMSPRLERRRSLVVVLGFGLFALTAGSSGVAGSVLDAPWTALLDGALAPFRNIHKFDPVVRVPLALGFAAAVDWARLAVAAPPTAVEGAGRWRHWRGRLRAGAARRKHAVVLAVTAVFAVPVLLAGLPMVKGDLRDSGGFTGVPEAWRQAASYLEHQRGVVRSLVLPGSGFGIQTWGRTTDEPMQVVSDVPWSARTQTPLMSAGTIRWLDQVEEVVGAGRPDPTFAPLLARAGITHLVVRNDLDYAQTDSPRPEVVHRLLDGSPGLLQVAHFGRSQTLYPAVEIYAVAPATGDPRVGLMNAADALTVSGGAEATDQLLADGVLDERRAMLRARGREIDGADVLTDTLTRVERNFGRVHDAASQVMTAGDTFRTQRAAHDYLYDDADSATVARYSGISRVLASSSSGYADTLGPVLPEQAPYAAVDGSLLTSWVSAPFADPRGAWIEVQFAKPTVVGPISMQFDLESGAGVRRVAVDTDAGRRTADVDLEGGVRGLAMEAAPTRRLRITVLDSNRSIRPVILHEIAIGGLRVERALAVPGAADADTSMSFRATVQHPACIPFYAGLSCGAQYQRLSVDSSQWSRLVTVEKPGTWDVSGVVVPAGGEEIAALLAPLDPTKVRVSASSWFGGEASTAPQNAFDGQPATTWVSAAADRQPVLDLRWDRPRRIIRIVPRLAPGTTGHLPDRIRVESSAGTQELELGGLTTGLITPVRTTFLRLTLLRNGVAAKAEPGDRPLEPVAISELAIDGLAGETYHADARTPTGSVCGFGPRVDVDGRVVLTRVTGTIGDVIGGAPLRLEACGRGARGVRVEPGAARITVHNAGGFAVRDLTLRPSVGNPEETTRPGPVDVLDWGSARRAVAVDVDRDALLTVTQGLNPGWVATLRGKELTPVEVDGWMQAWWLPAGSHGTVELRYAPQTSFLVTLLGGLALAAGIVLAAAWLLLRRSATVDARLLVATPDRPLRRRGIVLLLAAFVVLSLPAAAGTLTALVLRSQRWAARLVVACVACVAVTTWRRLPSSLVAPEWADIAVAIAFGLAATMATATRDREGGS